MIRICRCIRIGVNGMDVIISEISIKKTGEYIENCRLYTGQETTLELELGHSHFEKSTANKNRDGHTPFYFIFSGVKDPTVQALAALVEMLS